MTQPSTIVASVMLDDIAEILEWLEDHDLQRETGNLNGHGVRVSAQFVSEKSGQSFVISSIPVDEGRKLAWTLDILEPLTRSAL